MSRSYLYKRVARGQTVRQDGRLPIVWLRYALSKYINQRIHFVFDGHEMNGVYQNVWKDKEGIHIELRKTSVIAPSGKEFYSPFNFRIPVKNVEKILDKKNKFWYTLLVQLGSCHSVRKPFDSGHDNNDELGGGTSERLRGI